MSRQNRISKGKQINPTFFIFCEGETEEQYISFLRAKYRLPIVIDAKIAGNRITSTYIRNYKSGRVTDTKDKTYLVYDLDVPEMLKKLEAIPGTILLSSNPCFELWYLLHYQDHKTEISSAECNKKICLHHKGYKKGIFDFKLREKLAEKQPNAIVRASKLVKHKNPSTQVYQLIKDLEGIEKK